MKTVHTKVASNETTLSAETTITALITMTTVTIMYSRGEAKRSFNPSDVPNFFSPPTLNLCIKGRGIIPYNAIQKLTEIIFKIRLFGRKTSIFTIAAKMMLVNGPNIESQPISAKSIFVLGSPNFSFSIM